MQHSVFGFLLARRDGTAERDAGRQHGAVLTMERNIPSVSLTFGALILVVAVGVLVYGLACLIVARPLVRQILGLLRTIGKSAPAKSG